MLLGRERTWPRLTDPDYLCLRARRDFFLAWTSGVQEGSEVLDVGGRIQPYRELLPHTPARYVGLDPQVTGLVDVVGFGEQLPFREQAFDLVICTGVLSYVAEPHQVLREIYRVLKPGGLLFLSAPAVGPRYHDERWRFFEEGFRHLLRRYIEVEVVYETRGAAGVCRTFALLIDEAAENYALRKLLRAAAVAPLNLLGLALERAGLGGTAMVPFISAAARRPLEEPAAGERGVAPRRAILSVISLRRDRPASASSTSCNACCEAFMARAASAAGKRHRGILAAREDRIGRAVLLAAAPGASSGASGGEW